jgi:hypothetical protein
MATFALQELYISGALTFVSVLLALECRDLYVYRDLHTTQRPTSSAITGDGGRDVSANTSVLRYIYDDPIMRRVLRVLLLAACLGFIGSRANVPIQYAFDVTNQAFYWNIVKASVAMGVRVICFALSARQYVRTHTGLQSCANMTHSIMITSRYMAIKTRGFVASVLRVASVVVFVCAQIAIALHWYRSAIVTAGVTAGINFADIAIATSLISIVASLAMVALGKWSSLYDRRYAQSVSTMNALFVCGIASSAEPWIHVLFHLTSILVLFNGPQHLTVFVVAIIALAGLLSYFSSSLDHQKEVTHENASSDVGASDAAKYNGSSLSTEASDHHKAPLRSFNTCSDAAIIMNMAIAFVVVGLSRFVFLSSNQRLSLTDLHVSRHLVYVP